MAKLVLAFKCMSNGLCVEVIENDTPAMHGRYIRTGVSSTYLYESGVLHIGNKTVADSTLTRDPQGLRDKVIAAVSKELFNGLEPAGKGDVYTWQVD